MGPLLEDTVWMCVLYYSRKENVIDIRSVTKKSCMLKWYRSDSVCMVITGMASFVCSVGSLSQ